MKHKFKKKLTVLQFINSLNEELQEIYQTFIRLLVSQSIEPQLSVDDIYEMEYHKFMDLRDRFCKIYGFTFEKHEFSE